MPGRRPIAALLICLVIVGGLFLYMNQRPRAAAPGTDRPQTDLDRAGFSLEVTTTFALEPDPYALKSEGSPPAASLLIRLGEAEILRLSQTRPPGRITTLGSVPGLKPGQNEFYVEAYPPLTGKKDANGPGLALRFRLKSGHRILVDETLWSEAGRVAGTITVSIDDKDGDDDG